MNFDIKIKQPLWAVVFAFLSMFILGLADNIRGPLFPEVLHFFDLSSVKGSWSFATTSGAAFIGSYTSFYILKKQSLSTLLAMAVLAMATGIFVMGAAPEFPIFILGSFFLGISIGWMSVSQNLMISETVNSSQKSQRLSAMHAVYGLASFLAPVMAAGLTYQTQSWRSPFFLIAVLGIFYLMVQITVKSDPVFDAVSASQLGDNDPVPIPILSLVSIGGVFAFYVVAEILIATRLAQYMRNYFDMDLMRSSEYVTYFFLFLLLGRIFFAFKTFKKSLRFQMNLSLGISLILLILGLKFHPIILTFVGLSMAPFYPLSVAYISEMAGTHVRKFFTFAMAFQSLAVVTMHLSVGYLTDQFGLLYAFGVGIFAIGLALTCLNFHPKKLY